MKAILIEKSVENNSRGGSTKFLILFGGFRARLANKSLSYEPYDLIFVPSNRVGVTSIGLALPVSGWRSVSGWRYQYRVGVTSIGLALPVSGWRYQYRVGVTSIGLALPVSGWRYLSCPVLSYVTFCNVLVHLFSFLKVGH